MPICVATFGQVEKTSKSHQVVTDRDPYAARAALEAIRTAAQPWLSSTRWLTMDSDVATGLTGPHDIPNTSPPKKTAMQTYAMGSLWAVASDKQAPNAVEELPRWGSRRREMATASSGTLWTPGQRSFKGESTANGSISLPCFRGTLSVASKEGHIETTHFGSSLSSSGLI